MKKNEVGNAHLLDVALECHLNVSCSIIQYANTCDIIPIHTKTFYWMKCNEPITWIFNHQIATDQLISK